jgi:hypothetical protein
MARLVGKELDPAIFERLSGHALERVADQVLIVISLDDAGWPHPALLSYLEVVAKDRSTIRLAPYRETTVARAARRRDKLTLVILGERLACYIKGTVSELAPRMLSAPENVKLNLQVEQVLTDATDERMEGETYVASGVSYYDAHLAQSLAKGRRILAELLE